MNTAEIQYEGGLRTTSTHVRSGSVITTDAPVDNHGRGEAFSPTDLLASSLVSCIMSIMGIHANSRKLDMGTLTGSVKKIMAENPRRVARLVVEIHFEGHALSPEEQHSLELVGRNCPVAKSIHPDIEQDITFHF